jgi:hypothetical protein
MRIIDFLYYILYRAFYQYSGKKEKMPSGTSLLLTLLSSTNTILLLAIVLKFGINKGYLFPYYNHIKVFFGSIFLILYFSFKRYFIKENNYVRIVAKYDTKYKNRIKLIRFAGFLYLILTPLSLIMIAILIGRL